MEFQDQMGRVVQLSATPQRLVSLVPSQTEFLLSIGANVVGRTKFCIHPSDSVSDVPIVGGTKQFRFRDIEELNPDLIIGNKEENAKEPILELSAHRPVWMSDVRNLDDAWDMMFRLGHLLGRQKQVDRLVSGMCKKWSSLQGKYNGRVVYLIWRKPWMAAGTNTFIDAVLNYLGFENIVRQERYPELDPYIIRELRADYVFFSSEPFPFSDAHIDEFCGLMKPTKCMHVNGEYFSWYGSRLDLAADYLSGKWLEVN